MKAVIKLILIAKCDARVEHQRQYCQIFHIYLFILFIYFKIIQKNNYNISVPKSNIVCQTLFIPLTVNFFN